MRIYRTFPEAFAEIKRDLKEMGVKVENTHMQNRVGYFPTLELLNYGYTVLDPQMLDLQPTQPWANDEWQERVLGIEGRPVNPGEAYKLRAGNNADKHMNWKDYLDGRGRFDYTYSERFSMGRQVRKVVAELKRNPESRQLYIALWEPGIDASVIGRKRVPCSLGWHLILRGKRLHITYFMRSCDFITHFQNDVWMSLCLQRYVANEANVAPGNFSQFINSLHVYEKDVADVF